MKLFLFGGCETELGQAPQLKQMINNVIQELKPKQLLHLPFARMDIPEGEEEVWGHGWVERDLDLEGIELLDARKQEDIDKADKPLIFANGGPQHNLLYDSITQNKKLYDLVMKANYYIGESAGSCVTAEYRRTWDGDEPVIKKGLGILPDTIIKAHYAARQRQQALRDHQKLAGATIGLGIDSLAAIIVDTASYPDKYEIIGNSLVEMIRQ